jgi:hypothetical protein
LTHHLATEEYGAIVANPEIFRMGIDARFVPFTESFSAAIANGYRVGDLGFCCLWQFLIIMNFFTKNCL